MAVNTTRPAETFVRCTVNRIGTSVPSRRIASTVTSWSRMRVSPVSRCIVNDAMCASRSRSGMTVTIRCPTRSSSHPSRSRAAGLAATIRLASSPAMTASVALWTALGSHTTEARAGAGDDCGSPSHGCGSAPAAWSRTWPQIHRRSSLISGWVGRREGQSLLGERGRVVHHGVQLGEVRGAAAREHQRHVDVRREVARRPERLEGRGDRC